MKKIFLFLALIMISGCVAGEFTPKRHAQYEEGHADCQMRPELCTNGVPW